jgi:hypothetical protein
MGVLADGAFAASTVSLKAPTPQNCWEVKFKISRLRLEMTGVYLTRSSSPTPRPSPQFGRGAPRSGRPSGRHLSGQKGCLNRLFYWPLHRRALAPP